MTTNFYLDLGKSDKEKAIFLYIRGILPKKVLKLYTGERVKPELWDKKKQRVKNSAIGNMELNVKLNSIEERVRHRYTEVTSKGSPSYEIICRELKALFSMPAEAPDLFGYYESYIERLKKTSSLSHSSRHKVVLKKLREFTKSRKLVNFSFESVSPEFYDDFCLFLVDEAKLLDHVALRYFRYLRMFIQDSWKKKLHNVSFPYECPISDEKPKHVTLSATEIGLIRKLDLSNSKRLHNARNILLLQIFTGLRYGDLRRLNPSSFDMKQRMIHITTSKTNAQPVIPITDDIHHILAEYPDFNIRFISHQKQLQYNKELCKLAEIKEPVTLTRRRNGKLISETKPKYEWIGTHTFRRSKITILDSQGFSIAEIMQHTGHVKQDQVLQYIHHERNRIADKLRNVKIIEDENGTQEP